MKLLFALTYYRPHLSGLTVYVERLAEALVARGHAVTVLAAQHDAKLPREETLGGVRVVRVPVAFRVSKGAAMPSYANHALPLLRSHDAALINLPATPAEAVILTSLARAVARRPVVANYNCDLRLPEGLFNRAIDKAVFLSNLFAGSLAHTVVGSSQDYARHSRFLRKFGHKLKIITPPVKMHEAAPGDVRAFRLRHAPGGEPLIGFAARFAAEKGVEYLLEAVTRVRVKLPGAKLIFTGDPATVIGEGAYRRRMQPPLERARDYCHFLGALESREMPAFYAACDVTALPSTNSTESFGLVQVESMLSGTPVVASDLPGVRVPVQTTGMGRVVAPRDAGALADAIIDIILHRQHYVRPRAEVERHFSFEATVREYESLFQSLTGGAAAQQ